MEQKKAMVAKCREREGYPTPWLLFGKTYEDS